DDKLQLESQLILATAEPLCLDPSISVTCTANRLLYNKQKMNTRSMKCFKRHSRAALNRQQELSHLPVPPQLRLYDYLQKRKERKPAPVIDLKISKVGNCVDMWKQNNCQLTVPKEIDKQEVIDDYTFECEVGGQAQRTKVSIFQSMGDPLVYGKIYSAKETKAEEDSPDLKLIHPFLIGSKIDAEFLTQYKGVYEKDVKCEVRMSHNSGNVGQGPLSPSKDELQGDGISPLVQTSVLGKGVKHRPPPIKLPSGSGSSSSNPYSSQTTSGLLKCPTPPPPAKSQTLNRKHSMELGQVGLLSPASLSPMGSTQSGTPKPSTPTPTNTPCSTPHPTDALSTPLSVTPTPSDPAMVQSQSQAPLLTPFAQQQLALSQPLPVMSIPLPTMGTSITTGSTSSQVMANPGLNFINVVSSVSPQTLMSGSNPMLGPGLNLSGILPPAGLMSTMQSGAQTSPFGLNNSAGLRPLNLLQIPPGPYILNSLQQQQLSQFSPQQSQSATSSPQQQGEMDQSLGNQQTAVINLGVGSFMSPQTALSQLGCGLDGSGPPLPSPRLQQQHQPQIQLQFLQHQMQQQQMAMGAAVPQVGAPRQHTGSQPRSKRKRSTPQPLPKS
uniref:SPT20 homolog, SAGA complex component n=1 Tax=Xiphophorus couchianus TaxID=32473 RepID=A0A3B5LRE2_9TELE